LQITPDGRLVLFESDSSDLVANDTNGKTDVFIRDLQLETTRLVSANNSGTGTANGYSMECAMTPNARYVAFVSDATDLTGVSPGRPWNVFLRDMQTGSTTIVSLNCNGIDAGSSGSPALSDDGRYVAFMSLALDMVPGDFRYFPPRPFGQGNIYRRDLLSGETKLLSADYALTGGSSEDCGEIKVSGDGKVVLFVSGATDLSISRDDINGPGVGKVYAWREFPPGTNVELRVTAGVTNLQAVMVVTVTVTNFGPDTATDVFITNTISSGAEFLTATTTQGTCAVDANTVICAIGTLERRGGALIKMIVTPTATGQINLTADGVTSEHDPLKLNNLAEGTTALTVPVSGRLMIGRSDPWTFVSWLQESAGVRLESSRLRGEQLQWSSVASDIFNNGVTSTLILTNRSEAEFYRLYRP
jgi:uncharacterized repeat protein (TIGR01451 family)